jgi:hypothetical protein
MIMLNIKEFKNKEINKFVEKMFEARQVSHNYHLKTKSYSEHKALENFYNDLLNHIDNFVETYQGQYGLLTNLKMVANDCDDVVSYLEDFCSKVKVFRETLKENHLQNILDEIVSLTYKTIYKLKYLK